MTTEFIEPGDTGHEKATRLAKELVAAILEDYPDRAAQAGVNVHISTVKGKTDSFFFPVDCK